MERWIECVPNFSEGRNKEVIDAIVAAIERGGREAACDRPGVKVLNVDPGEAANRTVVTFVGSPEAVVEAAFHGVKMAGELIDMRVHQGRHPRSGATDVLPLIPLSGISLEECAELARRLSERIFNELEIPCYCYEAAAYKTERRNLAVCRSGGYEALEEKIADPGRRPDFGPETYTEQAAACGATNVGARDFLIAVNFNLDTTSADLATEIAYEVREKGHPVTKIPGVLKGCKAIGWYIDEYGVAQVSMNITDINTTPLHTAYEEVCRAATAHGLRVTGTEIIGLVPKRVLIEAGRHFIGKEQTEISEDELISSAIRSMGLDDLKPFEPREKVIEFLMESKPKVSIVMSIYNEPLRWLQLAVESMQKQTFRDYEFIIVCDNPDFSEGIAYVSEEAAIDSRIKLIINEKNIGPTKSFNKAIAVAAGEYIARMDADDIAMPERLEKQVAYLDSHPQISVCATDVHIIDREGKITRRNRYSRKRDQALNVISNSMAHPSVMFRRSLVKERFPLYNEDFTYSQDYELWMFLISKGHGFHTLKDPLLHYRKSSSQISSSKKKAQTEFFKTVHKKFITDWLTTHGIITEEDRSCLKTMLKKSSSALHQTKGEDREYLKMIIYVLYFSMGTYSWGWRFRYLIDRNLILFRIGFIYTFRLFFSSKTRSNRTGFN